MAQHSFNLRVKDLTHIPIQQVESSKKLKAQLAKALTVSSDDLLEEILTDTEYRGQPLLIKDSKGNSLGILLPAMLISQLISAYQRLIRYVDCFLETVDEAVCGIDGQQRVVIWNKNAEKMYNLSSNEVLGNTIHNYFNNLVITGLIHQDQQIKSHYHQPCEGKHVLINASSIKVGEEFIGGISCERDITELVQLNQQLAKTSSKVKVLEDEIKKISNSQSAFDKIVGRSNKITEAVALGKKVAGTDAPVLIRGESGTGKEMFARALHLDSHRKDGPFITVNCGAIPGNLFESELFGYTPAAFTGATAKGKPGIFQLASGGTVFLDEVGELPKDIQAKLLRVLKDKVFYPMGSMEPVQFDVRVIAATHRDLESMVSKEQFRDDLYYSLSVVQVDMPPLKKRKEDIPELVHLFIQEFSQIYGKTISKVSPKVTNAFLEYTWPGNVRELKNAVERLVVLAENEIINEDCLPDNLRRHTYISLVSAPDGGNLTDVTVETERQLILKTLEQVNGNRSETARILGIPRSTLYYKLRQLGIPTKDQG
ncbi:sigma-54 interaction domain-containing protein [Desulfofalx alkaliphila]|uniref:sigma-54 interaction domain-containing protein n=1 Tax=Desulfofalx alkaliphila TaxID=105483 RepID=UPI000554A626|nr:sigma-54-dependent Fis family transcriptional regulator [Desulfofalx alkaliphila]